MGYASFYYLMKKIDRKLVVLIILLLLSFSIIIFSLVKKKIIPSNIREASEQELLSPSPTIIFPPGSEKEDFVEEEFKTKPKKAYDYTLSNGQTITIYVPEDVNPPPLSVVEEIYRSKQ